MMNVTVPVFLFLFGAVLGSFGNVLIHRLPRKEDPAAGRSRCPGCGTVIRWYDNIPLLSFALLRGRCRDCGGAISWRYPLVEALTGALFVLSALRYGLGAAFLFLALFTWALVVITFIDLDHFLIPDVISLPGIAAGFLFSIWPGFPGLLDSLLGALAGGGILWGVGFLYKAATGREGMGFGDVKLLAMIGAFLGWQSLPLTILGASLTGSLVGVVLMAVRKKDSRMAVPFGPFLALGALIHMFAGREIISWYLSLAA